MPRYPAKTYGRSSQKESYTTKVFDDILKDNRPSATKAATTGSKWGKTSFTSTRTALTPTPMDESEPKKRRLETSSVGLFDDPFSFDDNDSPDKSKKSNDSSKYCTPTSFSQNQPKLVTKPVALNAATHTRNSSNNRVGEPSPFSFLDSSSSSSSRGGKVSPDDDDFSVRKTAIKTYGRSSKNGASKTLPKPLISGASKSNMEEKTTTSIDLTNSQKMPILTINRERFNKHKLTSDKPVRKKFFVSSPTGTIDLVDHNYSHKGPEGGGQAKEELEEEEVEEEEEDISGTQETKLFESDYEFDSNEELESGDPEIIFNSPKKRALEAGGRSVGADKASDNDTVPDDDMCPASPFSISDEEVEEMKEARYKVSYNSGNKHTLTLTKSYSTGTPVRRPPLVTYSRRATSSQPAATSSSDSYPSRSVLDTARPARSDSPASVDSCSSTSSSSTHRPTTTQLTYSRKGKMADKAGAKRVRKLLTSPKKSVAVYNPRPWSTETDGSPPPQPLPTQGQSKVTSIFDDFDDLDEVKPVATQPKFRRRVTMPETPRAFNNEPVSKLEITREHKPLFTVVRHVKQAHECQEHGETQEFEDDIDYILSGLSDGQKETLRCLSTISLVGKCAMPAFRMHLRAHGTLTKIFSALHDAPNFPTLALCTAGVMFMLSRDRLNMDLDKTSLQLMLNLLSVDSKIPTDRSGLNEYNRMKKRIQAICESLKVEGKKRHFHLDLIDISPGKLAMETLLSLTSKKAGDWFKEELRELGGLDHIVNTVGKCSDSLDEVEIEPSASMLDSLRKIDRCLRVLENVTLMNTENQRFLIHYNSSELIQAVCGALTVCENCQPFNSVDEDENGQVDKEATGYIVFSCLLGILRVLLNLTHDNEIGCRTLGQQPNITRTILRCILQVPQYICTEQRFDLLVLSLGLMINMMEHCEENRQILLEEQAQGHYDSQSCKVQMSALSALTQFFLTRFEAAERLEAEQEVDHEQMKKAEREKRQETEPGQDADASGQWQESESGLEWVVIPEHERGNKNGRTTSEDEDTTSQASDELEVLPGSQEEDENFTKALHKAGRHMEDSIIAAYVSLLIGVIMQNNDDLVDDIREELPDGSFAPMIKMLRKFLGFMNFTSSVSNTGGKSIIRVIKTLESF